MKECKISKKEDRFVNETRWEGVTCFDQVYENRDRKVGFKLGSIGGIHSYRLDEQMNLSVRQGAYGTSSRRK